MIIMFRLLIIIALLSATNTVLAQVQSSPFAPPAFFAAYDKDIKHMAVAWAYDNHTPDTAFIDIPASAITPIANGLAAIFNTGSSLKGDTIFANYCLHNDNQFFGENDGLEFLIDTSYAWTSSWRNYQVSTGIPILDQTLASYGFSAVSSVAYYPGGVIIKLYTSQFLNCRRLADSLSNIPGIIVAGWPGWGIAGSANQIFCDKANNGALDFRFLANGGFSPAQLWEYKVMPGYWVDSIAIFGSTLNYPDPFPNCGLHSLAINPPTAIEEFTLAPNPAADYLLVKGKTKMQRYYVLDMQGRILLEGDFSAQNNRLLTAALMPGNYCLRAVTIDGKTVSRLFGKE